MGDIQIWTKPITPVGSLAFGILNLGVAMPTRVTVMFSDLGLHGPNGYNVTEVFDNKFIGIFKPMQKLTVTVNPSGVFFGKAVVISGDDY